MKAGARVGVVVAGLLAGCTTTKVLERNGCWVRRTERLGNVKEEMGPCVRPQPKWSDDRVTRIVQECVARADYRWQGRALAAWSRGERMPLQSDEADLIRDCTSEAHASLRDENDGLKGRVAELAAERDGLRSRADDDRTHLLATQDRLAEYLGEAAKKPLPPATATATATSDGRARTEGALTGAPAQVDLVAPPATQLAASPAAPVAAPAVPAAEPERPALKRLRAGRKQPRIEKTAAPEKSACPAAAGVSPCDPDAAPREPPR